MSIAEKAASGDRRATLEALRDDLAVQLDGGAGAMGYAALALRLQSVLEEIDALPDSAEVTDLDGIAARLSDRLAAAGVPQPPSIADFSRRRGGGASR